MVTKGNVLEGAFKWLRIWGITSKPTPEEFSTAIDILDDYALEVESDGLLVGYMSPAEYGCSDPNDDSGLADWMAGPFKKLLAPQLLSIYGKPLTQEMSMLSVAAMKSLEHALVNVRPTQNPATLPKGSGNEWAYRDNKFYSEEAERIDTEVGTTLDEITLEDENQNCFP